MSLLAGVAGGGVALGILMLIMYFRPGPEKTVRPNRGALTRRWQQIDASTKRRFVIGLVIGLVVAFVTSFPAMVLIIPIAVVGLPALLGKPSTKERELLTGLEMWARSLAGTSDTGVFTLKEVIGITRGSVPEVLQKPVDRLYARMSTTWSTTDALYAFGDELGNSYADEVVLSLIQAAEFNAGGLSTALNGIADSLSVTAKNRIDTEVEREKPRDTLKIMTGIVAIVLVLLVLASGTDMLSFYRTPIGTIVLGFVVAIFIGLLAWAKAMNRHVEEPRILAPREGAEA